MKILESVGADVNLQPSLTAIEIEGLRLLWSVCRNHWAELRNPIEAGSLEAAMAPRFPVAESPAAVAQLAEESLARLRLPLLENDWHIFLARLRDQGAHYASQGLSFPSWSRPLQSFREQALRYIFLDYADQPRRAASAAIGLCRFTQIALEECSESYLAAKDELTRQAENELRQLAEENAFIAEVGHLINSSLRIEDVYESFARGVRRMIEFDRIGLNLIDHKAGIYRPLYHFGKVYPGWIGESGTRVTPMAGTISQLMAETKQSILRADIAANPQFKNDDARIAVGVRSMLATPLVSKDKVIGSLILHHSKPGAFGPREQRILERLAAQIAPAVANAQLYRQLEINLTEMAVIEEVEQIIASSLDITQVYGPFAEAMKKLVDFDRVSVNLINFADKKLEIKYSYGVEIPEREAGSIAELPGTLSEQVTISQRPLVIRNLEERAPSEARLRYTRSGLKSAMVLPLIANGEVIGAIVLLSARPAAFGPREQAILEKLCHPIAAAVDNARWHEAAQSARQRLENILDTALDAIVSTDGELRITLFNDGAQRIFSYDASEVMGQPLDVLIPERRHIAAFAASATAARGMNERGEIFGLRKDGSLFPAEAMISQVEWGGEKIFTVILRDISQRKAAEAEIRQLNAELEQRVQARTAELEAANRELESFSYSVSHDLRAPLRAVAGFSRILQEDYAKGLDPEAQRYLRLVNENATQMGNLIDDLLRFSRLSRQPLEKRLAHPTQLAQEALENLRAETRNRQVQVNIAEMPPVQADPMLLRQVYVNLISNALKYSRARDQAIVDVGCDMDAATGGPVFYVRDNGVGFDMKYASKLFGVFQRLHRAEDYEGTGVGLAIVQRIVTRHGGKVWAEGQEGAGAAFYFTLPK